MHITFASTFLAVLSVTAIVVAAPTELASRQSTVRIMALGDSITGSPVRTRSSTTISSLLTVV
jgi:hypothetical protein